MQLFTPPQAVDHWRTWVWVMLFGLYALAVVQILLSCRPRLIAYGLNPEQFRELLLQAAQKVDPQAYWSADVLSLPLSAFQLAMEPTGSQRVHQVVHVGGLRNLDDWIKLERTFVQMGGQVECERSLAGWSLLALGSMLLVATIFPLLNDPGAAMAQLKNFLAR